MHISVCTTRGRTFQFSYLLVVVQIGSIKYFHIYNTPLCIKLNGFPFYDPVFQFKALSLSFSTKQKGWMGLPALKSGNSYPLGCCLLCSQLCRKWNTAHLLLRESYQIQTQTDTVWLSCSCDSLTLFRRKHQVIAELWQ